MKTKPQAFARGFCFSRTSETYTAERRGLRDVKERVGRGRISHVRRFNMVDKRSRAVDFLGKLLLCRPESFRKIHIECLLEHVLYGPLERKRFAIYI